MKKITTYRGKNVLVVGLGKSGVNSAKLLRKLGSTVTVNDLKEAPQKILDKLHAEGIKVVTGGHPLSLLDETDLLVKNPGIPYSNVLIAEALRRGLTIITEPELAYEILDAQMIGVTGTNGKTTTTTLISLMLNQGRQNGEAYVAGNIGIPASLVAQEATKDDVMVTELSSFQLMGTTKLRPHIAVLTNIYEAHTDYHGTRENYIKAKMNITKNQTKEDYFVVNWDSEEWRKLSEQSKATIVPFSRKGNSTAGAYEKDGWLYFREEKIMLASEIKIPGEHNVENALAAISVVKLLGQESKNIVEVLKTFSGVRHRTQYVTTVKKRKFYNDSKATNMEATEKALAGFNNPVVLLAGGLDRGFTFERLIPYFKNLRGIIVFGETGDLVAQAAKQAGVKQIIKTENVKTAVPIAYEISEENDVVLLSPACASWDQYPTFEVRGDLFIEAVEDLKKELEM
ncbi:UDP-N-acetylmuramoyl-L-alanine--D-glutamate ligase [Liquorilactobacillus hordei]|uniref:UDP-N-acetylmuramoylalanine--D-glutamate ligase n=1 Tax=Liquorilactobacillus hordei DSM 19519 TaxID=1423759 RepID=A0A0R1MTC1_9LACO|nr:UDP-N-acetylmuramoyl-L-alanine--D-glutamate ligase [Liquorilactobacillus hordei]KRL07699.1 UDP-N-acetylmuramoyl-L-alanyl-D-glutamate synthetase [Liquorilactobacillus hordei DSM 19519]QYH52663.1 UDP-N-acetylmuramoyl-L-alanine--D-glutamate ligase [Liquorilactobacillus hordei DSM 19519]